MDVVLDVYVLTVTGLSQVSLKKRFYLKGLQTYSGKVK